MAFRCLEEESTAHPGGQKAPSTPPPTPLLNAERLNLPFLSLLVGWFCRCLCSLPGMLITGVTGEPLLAVLAPAGPPQRTVLSQLERNDKLNLGATCTGLQRASLAWFPEVTVEVTHAKTDVTSLAAWLESHQAQLNLILDQDCSADAPEWVCSTIEALPAHLVSSLTADRGLPAAGATLTALTRLSFKAGGFNFPEPANLFRSLSRLRQLTVKTAHGGSIDRMLALPALKDLQALRLLGCKSQAAPQALAALTQLTALDLYNNQFSAIALLATLQRLQSLELSYCSLTAVPAQLSALTALTRLNLAGNALVDRGWQHLAPLIRLQDLNLFKCGLTAVPEQLSALSALTRLDLGLNKELRAVWQHFLPHTQLQDLDLSYCSSLAVLQPLSALAALTSLKLTGIQLWSEWQLLLPLTQLRELSCKQCSHDAVPEQLSVLTALSSLNMGSQPAADRRQAAPAAF